MEDTRYTYQVCIKCFTFNHVNYIEEAMLGFVMQKTSFPYVAVVVDDASTDGEPEVIKSFLEKEFDMGSALQDETEDYLMVAAKHKANENCTFVVVLLKYNHYHHHKKKKPYFQKWWDDSKYIAMCEGDDYWTDSLKLQKQVDYMESHPDVGLCCSKSIVFVQEDNDYTEEKGTFDCEKYSTILLGYNDLNTATTLFRNDLWLCCQSELNKKLPQDLVFDTAYWYWFARNSKIKFFNEVFSVYRVLPESACHTKDPQKSIEYLKRFIRLKIMFLSAYPIENEEERKVVYQDIINSINELSSYSEYIGEATLRRTRAYRIGKKITSIGQWVKKQK